MFSTSEDAEDAFYAAFSAGRMDDMMRVWATDTEVVCIHPGGPRLTGIEEIRHSWAQILTGSLPRAFTLRGRIMVGDSAQRIHILEENISVSGTNVIAPPVLATNVYRRLPGGWRMVLHHASVSPRALPLHETGSESDRKPRLH